VSAYRQESANGIEDGIRFRSLNAGYRACNHDKRTCRQINALQWSASTPYRNTRLPSERNSAEGILAFM
jgi:hypothetical protein